MKLVILITAQTEQSFEIATAWQKAGASGVTILDGNGFHRLQKKLEIRDDLPLIPSLSSLLRGQEVDTHLLLSVVDDDLAKQLSATTIAILGDMTIPGNGIIFTLDIENLIGLRSI
jgi:nitrogen regulatory protein PII